MKKLTIVAVVMFAAASAHAQSNNSTRIYTCDTTNVQNPGLIIEDEATANGALVEDTALIVLPNGMKAVQFAVRHTKRHFASKQILKVRYTVNWTDACGRKVMNGSQITDGLALNPQEYRIVQSAAMHADASNARLRIYVAE